MVVFLVQFAQLHPEFRIPELKALALIENIPLKFNEADYSNDSPFLRITANSRDEVKRLVGRAILVRKVFELWGSGSVLEQVIHDVKENTVDRWAEFSKCTFRFDVIGFGGTVSFDRQQHEMKSFLAFLPFKGKTVLKEPEAEFFIIEDFGLSKVKGHPPLYPLRLFMGLLVAEGNRDAVGKFNLKKRNYIGNTSMDAELSLIMANQALATAGKFVYDPFVGTGSFLMTCAHFGALTIGSDIDGRQIRGRINGHSIHSNIEQYNLHGRVLDTVVFDVTRHPWRSQPWFDAIVTDPPYGVRAGAKRLGRKNNRKMDKPIPERLQGIPEYLRPGYCPATKPYEMSDVLKDLLSFSAEFLNLHGRLVYWFPTVSEEYSPSDVPTHPCLELVANSEQKFGDWSRRLVTMQKIKPWDEAYRSWDATDLKGTQESETQNQSKECGHKDFREKYFAGFLRDPGKQANDVLSGKVSDISILE